MKNLSGPEIVAVFVLGFVLVVAFLLLLTWAITEMWKFAVVPVFGLPAVSMEQAFTLLVLARIFFATTSLSSGKS